MKQRLSQQHVQKQVLAPIMQKSIAVLLLPITELNIAISQELQNNPLLEVDENAPRENDGKIDEELRLKIKHLSEISDGPVYDGVAGDDEPYEMPLAEKSTLDDHLLMQLRLEFSDPLKIKIGEQIIGNINNDGFLETTVEKINTNLQINNIILVEEVLKAVQNFEPPGIAARNIRECLLLQLKNEDVPMQEFASRVIVEHFDDLCKKRFKEIAKSLEVSVDAIKEVAQIIATLEPKPARRFLPSSGNIYVKPDIFVKKDGQALSVTINNQDIPVLRINAVYKELLNKKDLKAEERDFLEERLQSALHFIKSINQRGETIRRVVDYIVEWQAEFFKHGHSALAPMTLADVAGKINRDESTVSRAIRNKYVDTPQGIYPLKFFFSSAITSDVSGAVAARGIQEEIWHMVQDENKTAPLSDQDIQERFKEKGVHVARRTIAKYRQKLGLPPSHLRKE